MGRGKQVAVLVLILILGLGCVYLGIQIKNKPEPAADEIAYLGSYKETSISLPVINESNGEEFLQLLRGSGGQIELFTILYNEDRNLVKGYKKYVLNEELKWDEVEADWMALEYFADTTLAVRLMAYADTGSLYFVMHDLAAELPQCDEVIRFTTSKELERVGVRGLYKKDEEERPIQISKLFITDNIVCITDELFNSYAYSLVTGELYASGKNAAPGSLACDGTSLYMLGDGCNTVLSYNISDGAAAGSSKLWDRITVWEEKESEYEILDFQLLSQDGSLYLSCQDGIYGYDQTSSEWKLLINGISCIFGRPSIIQQNFVKSGDCFFMYGRDFEETSYIAMYSRRTEEEDEALDLTDFTISAYQRNAAITEAVAAFQHENPSLRVIYDVALDRDPDLTIEDYRKQIQASIQAGTAADILICDELDYNAYINSGFFENISDLMKPIYTSSNLYGNITNAMAQTKIFVTPAKMEVYLAYGESATLKRIETLADLLALSERNGSPALGSMTYRQLADLLSSFYQDEYITDGAINAEALTQALTSLKTIVSAVPDARNNSAWLNAPVTSENAAGPGITKITCSKDFAAMLSCLKDAGTTYTAACGRFIPLNIVGINSSSKNIKTAKEFIRTMYSESVQQSELGYGIPLRKTAVDGWVNNSSITETDLGLLKTTLQSMNTVYAENRELNEAFYSVLELYMTGELSVEDTVNQILSYTPAVTTYRPYEGNSSDSLNILFVGESFTENSRLVESFTALTSLPGRNYTVQACVHSSESLLEQCKYMESDSYQTYGRIRSADIIILQEKGSALPTTVQAINRILSLCKEDSRIYYVITDRETDSDIMSRLSVFERVTPIPAGFLFETLTGEDAANGLPAASLLTNGNANALYGYITALAVYESVFGTLPENIDAETVTASAAENLLAFLPGEEDAAKQAIIDSLPDIVKNYCQEFYQ